MGEGYGCRLATALQAGCHCVKSSLFLHQIGSLFVHQIKDDTPIFNRQVSNYCTQQLACEVNGFVQIPYMCEWQIPYMRAVQH